MSQGLQQRGSIQARFSEHDPRLYNCNRDIAHNMKDMVTRVFYRLQNRLWPELETVLNKAEATDAEVAEAFDALCRYMTMQQENMRTEYQELLTCAGWFRCSPAAQVAVMALLGTVVLGYHYAGIREATLGGEGPALTLADLADQGSQITELLAMPRWRRGIYLRWVRLRTAWRILAGS